MKARLRTAIWFLILLGVAWGLRAPFLGRVQWNLDEGSTFTMAQQVREGAVLYRDAADNRGPLVPYLKAAVFAVAGDWNVHAVHVLLAFALGLAAFLLWDMCRRFGDSATGVGTAIIFSVLALLLPGPADALAAHTEWFVVLFSTLGFWLFACVYRGGGFISGLCVGLSFGASALCKQPGLLDFGVTSVLLALLVYREPDQRARLFRLWLGGCVGVAAIGALTLCYFWGNGALRDLIYYAWTYNTHLYVQEIPLLQRLATGRLSFVLTAHHAPAIGLFGIGGIVLLLFHIVRRGTADRRTNFPVLAWLILGWFASGVISTMLSGRTFDHYVIQVVPGLSLAGGWLLARMMEWLRQTGASTKWSRYPGWLLLAAAVAWTSIDLNHFRRTADPNDDPHEAKLYSLIHRHSDPTDRIFVWGYSPGIYLMSQRLPSTRFIYTNYLTGLIPWTNLDPLVDTTYAVVPGAWDRLAEDLSRHPPALIVDTMSTRGYLKYPLSDRPLLWENIRANYAQVSIKEAQAMGVRLFRRLQPGSAKLDETLPVNPALSLTGYNAFARNEPPRIHVTLPAGASQVELYAGAERIAATEQPNTLPVDALFFADASAHPGALYRAVVTTATGRSASEAFDFAGFAKTVIATPLPGPRLHLASAVMPPSVVDSSFGTVERSSPKTWRIFAPAQLEYACPRELEKISFVHQLVEPAQMLSDGYDLTVDLIEDGGKQTRLLLQRLHPRDVGRDQLAQHLRLTLPAGHRSGRLVFHFLCGAENNADADRIDMEDIQTKDNGPALRLGDQSTFPDVAEASGTEAMKEDAEGHWSANVPAKVEWPRPPAVAAVTFQYGIDEGAYTKDGHSDGVEFSLVLVGDNGKNHALFSRLLAPYNHPEDRGPQTSRIELPPNVSGRLILAAGPGPQKDLSWDWAWIGSVVGEGSGVTAKPSAPSP